MNDWTAQHIIVGFTSHRITRFMQHIYEIPEDRFKQYLGEFRELLELDPFLNTPVRALSLGSGCEQIFVQPCCTIPIYLPLIS